MRLGSGSGLRVAFPQSARPAVGQCGSLAQASRGACLSQEPLPRPSPGRDVSPGAGAGRAPERVQCAFCLAPGHSTGCFGPRAPCLSKGVGGSGGVIGGGAALERTWALPGAVRSGRQRSLLPGLGPCSVPVQRDPPVRVHQRCESRGGGRDALQGGRKRAAQGARGAAWRSGFQAPASPRGGGRAAAGPRAVLPLLKLVLGDASLSWGCQS